MLEDLLLGNTLTSRVDQIHLELVIIIYNPSYEYIRDVHI